MTKQPEALLVRGIIRWLNILPGCKAIKTHGSAYGEAGTPDIFAVRNGQAYLLEVKTMKGKVSEIQKHRMKQWEEAGARVAVVRSVAEAMEVVQ